MENGEELKRGSAMAVGWREIAIRTSIAAALVAAVAIRFVDVDRDFPQGVTDSRVLYSDEGHHDRYEIHRNFW